MAWSEMKEIIQHDERDCGAACLAIVARYYGMRESLIRFRELTKTEKNGTNIFGIIDASKQIGLSAEALFGNISDLIECIDGNEIKFPFIAHTVEEDYLQHFIVVWSINNNVIHFSDPRRGKRSCDINQFIKFWSGNIIVFEKTPLFKPGNYETNKLYRLLNFLKGQYRFLLLSLLVTLLVASIGIIGAYIFQSVINNFCLKQSNQMEITNDTDETLSIESEEGHIHIESEESPNILDAIIGSVFGDISNFNAFFIMLVSLYLLQGLLRFLRGCLIAKLSKNIDFKLVLSYYNHIIDLPVNSISTRNTGEYLSRFSDASVIRNAISNATVTLFFDTIMVIGCGILLCTQNIKMFIISLLMIIVYAATVCIYKKPIENINRNVMESNARAESFLKESIDGVITIKANCAEQKVKNQNENKFIKLIKAIFKRGVIVSSQDSICTTVEQIGTVLILWVGFGMVLTNAIGIGELLTFYALLAFFTEPVKNLTELQPQLQSARVAVERLDDILYSSLEDTKNDSGKIEKIRNIEFSGVSFRYGNQELALKDISFKINKGDRIAIVGESGSGKTTIAKLLMKFYEPEEGEILINNINNNSFSVEEIRKKIAYVEQNAFLFSDTIRNNIVLGVENVSNEELFEVCKLAKIDSFIDKLPQGLDTFLDENGSNLSGGQRQRIAIARAILKKPEILIFDEATSNLDTITENAIRQTIFSLNNELTSIIIAHRLNTIKSCDIIFVMEDGEIVEMGSHEELIKLNGVYKRLVDQNET